MKLPILTFLLLATLSAFSQSYISKIWVPDLGNGKYKNPVIDADYSDPDAIRVGDDFYMISSSFDAVP
ncbi:MAG: glycoside hydrolase, partial [Flavobacterium sp.]